MALQREAPPLQAAYPTSIVVSPAYLRTKRLLDLLVILLLAPVLVPVMAVLAVLIRLDSPGPVLFRQRRVGKNGKEFELYKFRSMYVNCDDTAHREAYKRYMAGQRLNESADGRLAFKLGADPRITRVGRVIRQLGLDELPQVWNIVRGDMSLVGPRPAIPYEVAMYSAYDALRLEGKPGLTGLWQVYGRSRVSFREMIEMDIAYLRQQSILRDLKLLFLTVPVVLTGRGGA